MTTYEVGECGSDLFAITENCRLLESGEPDGPLKGVEGSEPSGGSVLERPTESRRGGVIWPAMTCRMSLGISLTGAKV